MTPSEVFYTSINDITSWRTVFVIFVFTTVRISNLIILTLHLGVSLQGDFFSAGISKTVSCYLALHLAQ
jgi:hypothetical protein